MATSEIPQAEIEQQEESVNVVLNSKPLYRFVQGETHTLGIVVLIFGCAELLMAFQLVKIDSLYYVYISFWQGAVFLICGILSIHAIQHPSKRVVTVCLAMYVVTLIEIVVSVCYRILTITEFLYHWQLLETPTKIMQEVIETILFICSLCVSGVLIFLSTVARKALKSTRSQVIVQHIKPTMRCDTISTE